MQTRGFLQDNIFFKRKGGFFQDGKGGGDLLKYFFGRIYTLDGLNGMEFDLFREREERSFKINFSRGQG